MLPGEILKNRRFIPNCVCVCLFVFEFTKYLHDLCLLLFLPRIIMVGQKGMDSISLSKKKNAKDYKSLKTRTILSSCSLERIELISCRSSSAISNEIRNILLCTYTHTIHRHLPLVNFEFAITLNALIRWQRFLTCITVF